MKNGFRPQQGLTIMNQPLKHWRTAWKRRLSFRPQQGLTIMNHLIILDVSTWKKGFRPQQGLTIMNVNDDKHYIEKREGEFPSPTGVNYYEWEK